MKSKEKQKREQLILRLDPKRAQKVRRWAVDHMTKIQPMLDRGLDLVMQDKDRTIIVEAKSSSGKYPSGMQKSETGETNSAYNLHNVEYREWVEWVILVLDSGHEAAIEPLAGNIKGFLSDLAMNQIDGVIDAPSEATPDYARAARAARYAHQQLRLKFAAKRQKAQSKDPG